MSEGTKHDWTRTDEASVGENKLGPEPDGCSKVEGAIQQLDDVAKEAATSAIVRHVIIRRALMTQYTDTGPCKLLSPTGEQGSDRASIHWTYTG